MAADEGHEQRRTEIVANLGAVRERIAVACAAAGRADDEVTLVVVTKYFGASDVRILADLGVRTVGENRYQEAAQKAADCADLDLSWHFIGGIQSNKAAAIARFADVVESVDRVKLVGALDRGAVEAGRSLDCLVQVSLDPPGNKHGAVGRSGADPAEIAALAEAIAGSGSLQLRGLMAVAPLGTPARPAFERLAELRASFLVDHPGAGVLSAGMSGDLEDAIACGATHVRIGSAVLGARPVIK